MSGESLAEHPRQPPRSECTFCGFPRTLSRFKTFEQDCRFFGKNCPLRSERRTLQTSWRAPTFSGKLLSGQGYAQAGYHPSPALVEFVRSLHFEAQIGDNLKGYHTLRR